MEGQNYLGIYIGKDTATAACLGSHGQKGNILACFTVTAEPGEEDAASNISELVSLIADGCAERQLKFDDVAVAVNCATFMQHNIHSEFTDPKQIAQTVRFDTEEVLSTDIADVAVAFRVASSGKDGAELSVFTAQKNILTEILLALQGNGIDPVTMEPDVSCLSRFILQKVAPPDDSHTLFGIVSRQNGYFVTVGKSRTLPAARTFLVDPRQDRAGLFTRQIRMTTALTATAEPIDRLRVFDSTDAVDSHLLGEQLGFETDRLDLAEAAGAGPELLVDCHEPVDFAIACGAALGRLKADRAVNFRDDFMPYQGKKMRMQSAMKFLSISVCVMLIALGVYISSQLVRTNNYRGQIRDKLSKNYLTVMVGKTKLPKNPRTKLESELRRVQNFKMKGLDAEGKKSLSTKLTMLLKAFNKVAASTRLKVKEISLSPKTMRLVGSVTNERKHERLRTEIKRNKLDIIQDIVKSEGSRTNFTMKMKPIE